MNGTMGILRAAVVSVALLAALPGCIAAALTAASLAAAGGMDHTLNGITYKTFTSPIDEVQTAIIETLDRMAIELEDTEETDEGWSFVATASDRTIEIELSALSPRTTHMRVVANEGHIFFKDSATASEIIIQTANTLDESEEIQDAKN